MSSGRRAGWIAVEPSGAHGGEQRCALDEFVVGERVEAPLGRTAARVIGTAHPLQEGGDAARRPDLAHELDRADVDPELERRGGDERLELAGPQTRLDAVPAVLRQAAVVRGDHVVAEPLPELVREPLGQAAGVHEHQRGAVLPHVRSDPIEHVGHLLVGRHRFELAVGQLEREIEVALMAGIHDGGEGPIADEQACDRLDGALRRPRARPGSDARRRAPRGAPA